MADGQPPDARRASTTVGETNAGNNPAVLSSALTRIPRVPEDELPLRPPPGFGGLWLSALESVGAFAYVLVGTCFLVAAFVSFVAAVFDFVATCLDLTITPSGLSLDRLFTTAVFIASVMNFVSGLLLTLILLELMGSVIHYMYDRETTLKPFLFVIGISAVRSILSIGARLSLSGTLVVDQFLRDMVELGVNVVAILALGVTMKLVSGYRDEGVAPRYRRRLIRRR